jgi:hypothetical protein
MVPHASPVRRRHQGQRVLGLSGAIEAAVHGLRSPQQQPHRLPRLTAGVKQFREEWSALLSRYPDHDEETPIEDPPYVAQCEIIHQQFLARLQAADPSSFKGGFWENHAWNESILMHS